jgi:hypothetical protein
VLVIALKINRSKLENPKADIRYQLPEQIQYLSDGQLRDDGYDYAKDGELLLFLVGEDDFDFRTFVDKLFDEPFSDNDLSLATQVAVDQGDGYEVVYPPEFEGKFTLD